MGITDKTRKILWGRSGNRCAYCKCLLVIDRTSQDDESVVGDECHVIAENEQGARGISDKTSEERDSYQNLILLCKVHHKMVDDQRETYTVQLLQKLKTDHEKWVRDTLEPSRQTHKAIQLIKLPLIHNTKEIVQIVANAASLHTDYDTPENEHEMTLLKDFVGEFEGLSLLSDEQAYMVEATFSIKTMLHKLEKYGYSIYGPLINGKLTTNNNEHIEWRHGFIVIKKFRLPEIIIGYDPHFQF